MTSISVPLPVSIQRIPKSNPELKLAILKHQEVIEQQDEYLKSLSSERCNESAAQSLFATVIFAQEEAGSGVCVHQNGFILTCAHCIAEEEEEEETIGVRKLVIFGNGVISQVECVAWDSQRDLALLKVRQVITSSTSTSGSTNTIASYSTPITSKSKLEQIIPPMDLIFPFISVSDESPKVNSSIYCIGQPGRDDLESSTPQKTDYSIISISSGKFRGYIDGGKTNNLQNNNEIGQLKHDAWTYWGHSGAPLIRHNNNDLIGIHSSWDENTGMRHGIALDCIQEFLKLHKDLLKSS